MTYLKLKKWSGWLITSLILLSLNTFADKTYKNNQIKNIEILTENKKLKVLLEKKISRYKNKTDEKATLNALKDEIVQYLKKHKYRRPLLQGPFLKKHKKHTVSVSFKIGHPYQYFFILKNNKKIKTMHLMSQIQKNLMFSQSNFIDSAISRIESYYKSMAFNKVQVQFQLHTKEWLKTVKIKIKEGPRFQIKKLLITGSLSRKKKFYRKLFDSYASPMIKSGYYVKTDFNFALKQMIAHLRRGGFFNAKVYHKNISFKDNNVFIELTLNENQPLRVKTIIISGHKNFSAKEVKKIIGLKENSILNIPQLESGIKNLIDQYRKKHFLQAKISNKNDIVKIKQPFAFLFLKIDEGERIKVNDIKVKGNKKITSEFILHASSFKKGDWMSQKHIKDSLEFLNDLGLFSKVEIYPSKQKKSVIIDVQEHDHFGFLSLRGGVNTLNTLSAKTMLEYNQKNFLTANSSQVILNGSLQSNIRLLNYLRNFSPLFHADFFEYEILSSYKNYYLFRSKLNGQVSYSHTKNIFSFLEDSSSKTTKGVEWTHSDKFSFNLERKFDISNKINFKILEMDIRKSRSLKPSLTQKRRLISQQKNRQIISLTGLSFLMDRRDHFFLPKSGHTFSFNLDYSIPFIGQDKDIHFLKNDNKFRFYIPLFKEEVVLAHSISGGFIKNIPFEGRLGGVPVSQLFILGGMNSLRGFDGAINGERIPSKEDLPIENSSEIKFFSSAYFLVKNEVRFPIYNFLKGAVFYEIGNVYWQRSCQEGQQISGLCLTPPYYRHSVGFGLHFISPIGPVVLDIGFKLPHYPKTLSYRDEKPYQIHFSIGSF